MNGVMPLTTTATQLQRNYKKVVKMVKKFKEPVTVLSNNRPEIVVVDYQIYKDLWQELPKKKTTTERGLLRPFRSWTKKEADGFDKIIEDAFEQISPEGWK